MYSCNSFLSNRHLPGKAQAFRVLFSLIILIFALTLSAKPSANMPLTSTSVGDGPVKISVSPNGEIAAVVKLFPKDDLDSNLEIIEISSGTNIGSYRVGRRMIDTTLVSLSDLPQAGAINGGEIQWAGLSVFGDLDFARLVDLDGGLALLDLPTGSRPAAVTSWNSASNAGFFVVTNGSSSDLTVIDMLDLQPRGTISTGIDPRDTAIHSAGQYGFVAIGGEDRVDVVDFQTLNKLRSIAVGGDPVDVEIAADGSVAVVANLTSNTISVLDLSDPAQPTIRTTNKGQLHLPVGVQPSAIAITSDGSIAYVANTGSAFVTVVDVDEVRVAGVIKIEKEGAAIASAISAIALTPDDTRLLMTERGNDSRLLIYDTAQLALDDAPAIDIPGEPGAEIYLRTEDGFSCPGFYIAAIEQMEGAEDGFFGAEIATTIKPNQLRLLQGGFNLGGAFAADRGAPGFGAFNIANRNGEQQRVTINVNANPLTTAGFNNDDLGISVELIGPGDVVLGAISGAPPLTLDRIIGLGFHRVRIRSLIGSPRGIFAMSLATTFVDRAGGGFQGGVNVGGLLTRTADGTPVRGFVSFCISDPQIVKLRTEGKLTRGESGAGPMLLTIKDRDRDIVRKISNANPPSPQVTLPGNDFLIGAIPTLYVDDDAPSGGDGSQENPYNSITEAVGKAATPGDIIYVAPGTYSPSLTGEVLPIGALGIGLSKIPEGVSLFGAGAQVTTIDAENSTPGGNNVNAVVIGSSNVRVAGFTVRNSSAVGIYVNNGDRASVDHNFLTGNARFGIGSSMADGIVIYNNAVVANVESGIAVSGSGPASKVGAPHPVPVGCPASFGACIITNTTNDHRADGILASQGGDYAILENTCINNGVSGIELNNGLQPGGGTPPPLSGIVNNNLTSGNGGVQFAFSGTGILITEFAEAREITGNTIINNRPGGLAIFEDATTGTISNNIISDNAQNGLAVQKRSAVDSIIDNIIENNGLSGLFVEDDSYVNSAINNEVNSNGTCLGCSASKAGLAVLGGSSVAQLKDNNFSGNAMGFEINNGSLVSLMSNNKFDNSILNGGLVRQNSEVTEMKNSSISNSMGPGVMISASSATLDNIDVVGNAGAGVSGFLSSFLSISNSAIENNGGDGILADSGTTSALSNLSILGNTLNGIVATDGSTVDISNSTVDVNGKRGLSASGGASVTCGIGNAIGVNGTGAIFGDVSGCD